MAEFAGELSFKRTAGNTVRHSSSTRSPTPTHVYAHTRAHQHTHTTHTPTSARTAQVAAADLGLYTHTHASARARTHTHARSRAVVRRDAVDGRKVGSSARGPSYAEKIKITYAATNSNGFGNDFFFSSSFLINLVRGKRSREKTRFSE